MVRKMCLDLTDSSHENFLSLMYVK